MSKEEIENLEENYEFFGNPVRGFVKNFRTTDGSGISYVECSIHTKPDERDMVLISLDNTKGLVCTDKNRIVYLSEKPHSINDEGLPTFTYKGKLFDEEGHYKIEYYNNDVPINFGDHYLVFFGGEVFTSICNSEREKYEINENDLEPKPDKIDFRSGFWKNCYKIKAISTI